MTGRAFCVSCGAPRGPDDRFCRACGRAYAEASAPVVGTPSRAPVTAPVWRGSAGRRMPRAGGPMSRAARLILGAAAIFVGLFVALPVAVGLLAALLGDGGGTAVATRSPSPLPTVTRAPTPEPTVRRMTLEDALEAELLTMAAEGRNLQQMSLTLESLSDDPVEVVVPAGLVLAPASRSTQPMIVIRDALVSLAPGESATWTLDVACAAMELDQPDSSDSFSISSEMASKQLGRLVALDEFAAADFRVQQFAIWTLTDDPERGGFVRLGTFGAGSGPSDEELAEIKALFEAADIDPADYRALR